jgi:DNA-binding NarL/FixJ family response regulator
MSGVSVLLVDDQALFREGLRTLLSVVPGIEVLGEAANGEAAVQQVRRLRPQVVLMDLRMPVLNGVEATRRLRAEAPETRVIVLSTFDDDEDVFDALRAGAVGYLLKDATRDKLVEAIRSAARGESFLQPSVAAKVVAEFSRLAPGRPAVAAAALVEPLSDRELEVLRCLTQGMSN